MHVLQLASEMLLQISNNLEYADHFRWASCCRMLWLLSQWRLKDDKMHCLYGEAWAVEENMLEILSQCSREPSIALHVKDLILSTFQDDAMRLIGPSDSGRRKFYNHNHHSAFSEEALEYLSERFPEAFEESNQLETLEPFKIHILALLPNLVSMDFVVDCQDRCISMLFHRPYLLRKQYLQNLMYLTLFWCGAQDGLPLSTVELFIELPKLQSLTAWNVVSDIQEEEDGTHNSDKSSNVKDINFRGNNVVDSQTLTAFLHKFHGLQSFSYHAQTEIMEEYDSQILLRMLVHHHGNSLQRLCLSTNRAFVEDSRDTSTYTALQAFVELEYLECEWRDIIAGNGHDILSFTLPLSLKVLKLTKAVASEAIILERLLQENNLNLQHVEIDCYDEHPIMQQLDIPITSSATD